ncbi:hypothetical protein BKA70DRAFT_451696 [Coprinopsis sp. MPI-PUGE-AT-0042]|nr:hypothetical protein BKA70DRAFT_451696 [Coprinopsis sp. MPI-PUGE-AT-0042]
MLITPEASNLRCALPAVCTPSNPLYNYNATPASQHAFLTSYLYYVWLTSSAEDSQCLASLAEQPPLACLPLSHGVEREQEASWTASQRQASKPDWLSSTCDPSLQKEGLLMSLVNKKTSAGCFVGGSTSGQCVERERRDRRSVCVSTPPWERARRAVRHLRCIKY